MSKSIKLRSTSQLSDEDVSFQPSDSDGEESFGFEETPDDVVDECRGCNVYYEILAKVKSILHSKDSSDNKVRRCQDLVYIARLL